MKSIALLLLTLAMAASASDFSARERTGKAASASPEGQSYQKSWGQVIGAAMHACIPVGSESPSNNGKFAFVANINAAGIVSAVEVQPVTTVSNCFAKQFAASTLQPPPASLLVKGVLGYN
jgi:hypothetical protein